MKLKMLVTLMVCLFTLPAASLGETQVVQKTGQEETSKILLGQHFCNAGRHLRNYMIQSYIALSSSTLGSLIGTTREEERETWWGTETSTEPNYLGIALTSVGALFSLIAPYSIKNAGEELIRASEVSSKGRELLLRAGKDLKTYSRLTYTGLGLIVGGATLMVLGGKTENLGLILGGTSSCLIGIVPLLMAPHYVGTAGNALDELSNFYSASLQHQLISEAGRKLQTYTDLTYWSLALSAIGGTTAVVGLLSEDESLVAMGALVILGGRVLSWIAPWSIGAAGTKLEEAGKFLLRLSPRSP